MLSCTMVSCPASPHGRCDRARRIAQSELAADPLITLGYGIAYMNRVNSSFAFLMRNRSEARRAGEFDRDGMLPGSVIAES